MKIFIIEWEVFDSDVVGIRNVCRQPVKRLLLHGGQPNRPG